MVKCDNAGLAQCKSIADGLVKHVDGDEPRADALLERAAAANDPAALATFVDSLPALRSQKATRDYLSHRSAPTPTAFPAPSPDA